MSIKNLKVKDPAAKLVVDNIRPPAKHWEPKQLETHSFPDQPAGNGAPPPTIANVKYILDGNGIVARYNVIKKKFEIAIPDLPGVIDNSDSVAIAHVKSLLALHGMQTGEVRGAIEAIANQSPYNPVEIWIRSRAWDGVDRLPAFYATLRTIPDYPLGLKEGIMRKWLLSATAAGLMPDGFSSRLVLTLQGPQSIGKTRWALSLVSDPVLRGSVVKIDHHFDGGNKDNILTAIRFWIVELGELESSFRKDQERLKGILSRDRDVLRPPYAAADSEYPRRTVFLATVNSGDFLSDPTGSTRWGVIAVESINYEHGLDMQQLFAQMAVAFDAGEQWWLDPTEEWILELWNERHQAGSLVRDLLNEIINFDEQEEGNVRRLTATELLTAAGLAHPTQAQAREAGSILRSKFGPPSKIKGYMKWSIPLRATVSDDELPDDTLKKSKFD